MLKIQSGFGKTYILYKKGIPNASNVNSVNDPTAISAMWKTHFESLLNSVTKYAKCERVLH